MALTAPQLEMDEADKARLNKLLEWFSQSAEPEHKQYERAWDNQDRLYFGHKRFLETHTSQRATPKGRDTSLEDARKEFGAELHIPYVFSTLETVMPRTLSNRPRMLWDPRDKVAEANIENVRIICDAQQQAAQYELKLQTTCRSGLKHGLGVQKTTWRFDERDTFALQENEHGEWVRVAVQKTDWDDPDCEDVDIRDWYWDPYGDSMRNVKRVIHRTWRDTAYCLQKIQSGAWPKYPLSAEELSGSSGKARHSEAWAGRRLAMGYPNVSSDPDIHEVWEVHERNTNEVVTVIDRMWIVSVMANPYWHGQMPFQIYRPIEVEHRFVGIGVIDPIEDLQRELNWLRTDRRWNAMLKIHQSYAYDQTRVDPAQIKVGPGRLNGVNGDPNGLLVPLTVGDIPNSGYQEEAALRGDIQLASGVDDQTSGVGSAGETATGVQLVQAAAGLRIQAYTHRMELELIGPQADQWLKLNQQRWISERQVRFPMPPQPGDPEKRWTWRSVGPAEWAGTYEVVPEGGATAPDNIPQKRNDAMLMMQLLMSPLGMQAMDPNKGLEYILSNLDIGTPQEYIRMPSSVPPQTLDNLKAMLVGQVGMRPEGAQALIANALGMAQQQMQEQAQSAARAPGGAAAGQQAPTQNGAGPAPAPQPS